MSDSNNPENDAPNRAGQSTTRKSDGQVEVRQIKSGQYVFREGELGDIAFIVRAGTVEILKHNESGELVLGTLRKGGMFGEMALIDDQPRMASARAKDGNAEIMVITREMLEKKLSSMDPFVRALVNIMTSHIRTLATALMEAEVNAS
jgi:CRP/FNR family transcriptional regulator, cyclic AMP receptor protein